MSYYNLTVISYSILLIIGGIIGHQAGSMISLITSVTSGAAMLILFGMSLQGSSWAHWGIVGLIAALGLFFFYRWNTTGKFMPGGLLLLISVAALLVLFFTRPMHE